MIRSALGTALVAVLAATLASATPLANESPLLSAQNAKTIPGHYMVVLRDESDAALAEHTNWLTSFLASPAVRASVNDVSANRIKHVYDLPGVKGYAGKFDDEVIGAIRRAKHVRFSSLVAVLAPPLDQPNSPNPSLPFLQVAYIEQDQVVSITEHSRGVASHTDYVLQKDAPWGLSRIAHRKRPTAAHYKEYPYPTTAGANVSVYVIDTGINIAHRDFEGRARWGATIPENDEDLDGNGHGTHCAGTIAGKRFGVAKKAHPVAVKVLSSNGSGSMSDVVKGVEWAVQDHKRRTKKDKNAKSAANMSLGGGKSALLDRVVNAAVDSGIHFSVAAGNENGNACDSSPAAAEKPVTVGATALDDKRAYFSNYGKCVDIFAPGKDILSTWIGSDVATNTISGTSMASPHVAGTLAVLAAENEEPVAPMELKARLLKLATKDVITGLPKPGKGGNKQPKWPFPWPPGGDNGGDAGKSPNLLLFTDVKAEEDKPEPVPQPPSDGDDDGDDGDDEEDVLRAIEETHAAVVWIRKVADRVRVRVTDLF
ncbi:proteinase B [Blastocladiella emersonii ATCC 22665]|nr:proteinase B [Blastocladiella emersonii ATCC 22665]